MWRPFTIVLWRGISSGTTFSAPPRTAYTEIQPIDAVVVFRLRFDVHLFEPCHRSVGRRLEDADFRWPILERANEVLRVAGVRHAVAIGERDAVRVVVDHRERPRSVRSVSSAASAIGLPAVSVSCPLAAGRSVITRTRTSVPAGA